MNKNWYAVYTKPQCEKKVVAQLSKKKIESFAPVNNRYIGTGSKRKLVIEQLFPCFVFVNITEAEFTAVKQIGDVINFVYWLGRPAIIKAAEIENIYHFANRHNNILLTKIPVNVNGIVRITNAPCLDIKKGVLNANVNSIKITLPSLGYMMQAETSIGVSEVLRSDKEEVNLVN